MPTVQITMATETTSILCESGYILYAMRAVESSDLAGLPLIWFRTTDYSHQTSIRWTDVHHAFSSLSPRVKEGERVDPADRAEINVGQKLMIRSNAIVEVTTGEPGSILFQNSTNTLLSCGLAALSDFDDNPKPYCTFPILGANGIQNLVPTTKILLVFATEKIAPGTAVARFSSKSEHTKPETEDSKLGLTSAYLLDAKTQETLEVSFDASTGWNGGLGQDIPADVDLTPFLVATGI